MKREVQNGRWQRVKRTEDPQKVFCQQMIKTFAKAAARFEAHYIFCWLEWDGDNILADGGIIDFGSIRQFGLYYKSYRFDDDERWSTTIVEQKEKARYIATTFVQIYEYLKTGKKVLFPTWPIIL